MAIRATLDETATRSQSCWVPEWGSCGAGEPSCWSRNGGSGAAGKPPVLEEGAGRRADSPGRFPGRFLGWDSGERGEKPAVENNSLKLRRGKALVAVLTGNGCPVYQGKVRGRRTKVENSAES